MSEQLLQQAKRLPAELDWSPASTHPSTHEIEVGVLDANQARLRGLHALMRVLCPPSFARTGETWTFVLMYAPQGWGDSQENLFRVEIRTRPGIPAGHHDSPHAHRLSVRQGLPGDAIRWTWDDALRYFCQETNIAIPNLSHPVHAFRLRP